MEKLKIFVPELKCSSCANAIEKTLEKAKDLTFRINIIAKTVTITYDSNLINKASILELLKKSGFDFDVIE